MLGKNPTDTLLPALKKGAKAKVTVRKAEERVSKPPKRYTTGSIIDAMKNVAKYIEDADLKKVMKESEGIGTEATRAGIITDLQKSGYIEVKRNAIHITDAGKSYIESIRIQREDGTYDYGIADPVKVAYWSSKIKEVQLGKLNPKDLEDELLDT